MKIEDEEKYRARNLLKDVKENYEKPLQTLDGSKGRYVEAVCSSIGPEGVKKDEPLMILLCLPYFEIAPLSGHSSSQTPKTHQLRTLLQYSSSHTSRSKSRELQQAVCHVNQSPEGHCFHISYLWCLVIGNGTFEDQRSRKRLVL